MATEPVEAHALGAGEERGRREQRLWGWGHGRRGRSHGRDAECVACDRASGQDDSRLCEACAGDTVTVTGILGDEAFRGRVMALGILPGMTLRVVGGGSRQPMLVALPGSRCVVDRHSSEMIAVRGARPAGDHERTKT